MIARAEKARIHDEGVRRCQRAPEEEETMNTQAAAGSVDPAEVARFDALARTWWDPAGPMRMLHKFNPARLSWLRDQICRRYGRDPHAAGCLDGLTILDVGCGGGVLSEPLARLGATVTGLDPAVTNIEVARRHAEAAGIAIDYRSETVEQVVARGETFDVVLAMEVVEHVADVGAFVKACAAAAEADGLVAFATLNRTMRSFALAIVGAEYVLRWLPRGTHRWDKFVTPEELERALQKAGMIALETTGVVYNPLTDVWSLSRDVAVNYMTIASRP
jgi:2-polyprenyl-6-hydroxyphenyl methylase/3-demethylubiquinone-9 3-methyltransferase